MENWSVIKTSKGTFLVEGLGMGDEVVLWKTKDCLPHNFVAAAGRWGNGVMSCGDIYKVYKSEKNFYRYNKGASVKSIADLLEEHTCDGSLSGVPLKIGNFVLEHDARGNFSLKRFENWGR